VSLTAIRNILVLCNSIEQVAGDHGNFIPVPAICNHARMTAASIRAEVVRDGRNEAGKRRDITCLVERGAKGLLAYQYRSRKAA